MNFKACLTQKILLNDAVFQIIRLEHRTLWVQYQTMKEQMEHDNVAGVQNERTLWHGTDQDTVDKVIKYGFCKNFCGKNGRSVSLLTSLLVLRRLNKA